MLVKVAEVLIITISTHAHTTSPTPLPSPPSHHFPPSLPWLQDLGLGPDTVDISMETLASIWACDPSDLNNWRQTTPWGERSIHAPFNCIKQISLSRNCSEFSTELKQKDKARDTRLFNPGPIIVSDSFYVPLMRHFY